MTSLGQTAAVFLFAFVLWRFLRYWFASSALSRVPGPPRNSWWTGNLKQLLSKRAYDFHEAISAHYGGAVKYYGLFGKEHLYVSDPRALYHIVVKDQYSYERQNASVVLNSLVFGQGVLSTIGEQHKRQRKMMNPVFSMRHMKDLLPIFYPISLQLRDVLKRKVQSGEREMNLMPWMSRTALEYIGQAGLGYSFDALDESKSNEYSESIRMLTPTVVRLALPRQFLPYIMSIPTRVRRKLLEWAPFSSLQRMKSMVDIMDNTSLSIFNFKKEALERGEEVVVQQVGSGKDIMSVLLRANMTADENDRMPERELLAQMNSFIFGGYDTVTSATSRILHQLVLHVDVQNTLREEITDAIRTNGQLDYDTVMSLPLLDAVCRETMRVFPPLPFTIRTTTRDIVVPLHWPIKSMDGTGEIREISLKKNTNVMIAIMSANRSKGIWGDDAGIWRPERWLKPLPASVTEAHLPGVYASMMTFLGGGRSCLGLKFAEMEMKVTLSVLLESFKFTTTKEIEWNMGGIQSPVLRGSHDDIPQLPLELELVA
ncbi:cytochrome P450, partial [Rickenella mellea]